MRAGKTTSMASANISLPEICEAGEWSSKKTPGKHYVDTDVADHELQLRTICESEDELGESCEWQELDGAMPTG